MFHILGGAVVGAVIGAAASAISDVARGKPISLKKMGAAAVGGAVAGAITTATFGAGGAVATTAAAKITGMVAAGAAAGATEQVTDNLLHDKPWHEDVAQNTAIGAAAGGAFGVGGRVLAPLARRARPLLSDLTQQAGRQLARAPAIAAQAPRQGANLVRGGWQHGSAAVRSGLRGTNRAWNRYLQLLETHPMRTKSITAGAITGGGDMLAQAIEGGPWDWKRTAFMTAFGTLWVGPTGHAWYGVLGRMIPGRSVWAVGGRVLADQAIMAPFGTAVFFTATGAMKAETPSDVWDNVRKNFWPALKANYMVWPGVQAVNFGFVPQRLQVGFGNVISLGWTAYLSMIANDDGEDDAGLDGAPQLPSDTAGTVTTGPTGGLVTGPVPVDSTLEGVTAPPEGKGAIEALRVLHDTDASR